MDFFNDDYGFDSSPRLKMKQMPAKYIIEIMQKIVN